MNEEPCNKPRMVTEGSGKDLTIVCGDCGHPLSLLEYETKAGGRARFWRHVRPRRKAA
jgi:hypothetical protein